LSSSSSLGQLENCFFDEAVIHECDRERFHEFVQSIFPMTMHSADVEPTAASLHLYLRDGYGMQIPVQIFMCGYYGQSATQCYIAGIKEDPDGASMTHSLTSHAPMLREEVRIGLDLHWKVGADIDKECPFVGIISEPHQSGDFELQQNMCDDTSSCSSTQQCKLNAVSFLLDAGSGTIVTAPPELLRLGGAATFGASFASWITKRDTALLFQDFVQAVVHDALYEGDPTPKEFGNLTFHPMPQLACSADCVVRMYDTESNNTGSDVGDLVQVELNDIVLTIKRKQAFLGEHGRNGGQCKASNMSL
jgi:hypothetical protein